MPVNIAKPGKPLKDTKMKTVHSIEELREARKQLAEPVGFVPTMGYLHEGHISLVRAARTECASVVVSIFVNPTQFGPSEDFSRYPRDLERDSDLLKNEGVDLIWAPTPEQMYSSDFQTWVEVDQLTRPLEGERRPGHFRGVTTVVAKLFNGVLPQKAYFGQKDAQQAAVIRRMVHDLNFPIDIVVCPIVREPDGLALSSRNQYLNPQERKAALALSRSLSAAQQAFQKGERRAESIREILLTALNSESLARVQYVSCADPDTLQEQHGEIKQSLLSMAVYIGNTRLIDNCLLG